jgi:hypothetical protein
LSIIGFGRLMCAGTAFFVFGTFVLAMHKDYAELRRLRKRKKSEKRKRNKNCQFLMICYFSVDMKNEKPRERRKSVSISMLPSEQEALRCAAQKAGENSVSAYVKKTLMKHLSESDCCPSSPAKKGKSVAGR